MTVTYTSKVATCRGISSFLKLLARWRGSIYKLIWLDFTLFLFLYYVLNFTYRFKLDGEQKIIFENISKYCKQCSSYIPLSFVLGFYVSIVMARWWQQYISIPFPDSIAVLVSATLHGQDERARVMRRTILRYVCLCVTMLFTNISTKVKLRFPTLDHFVEAGLMLPSEKDVITGLNKKFPKYSKHWLPLVWAASIVTRARQEGRIRDDFTVKSLLDELNTFRGKCGVLITYDRISIPLVYTQVVTLAVYSFFLIVLMGDQWLEDHQKEYKFDLYFPIFTMLQFFFYTGWLKVAESLINPFGDDDDDFELNWMVDRNLQISYLIVDEMHQEHPELIKDQYWEKVLPETLPYTAESEPFREQHPLPSTANIAGNFYEDDAANDMMSSPISFSAKSGSLRNRSSSQHSFTNSRNSMISKANSLSSMVRRLLSRENSRTDSRADVRDPEELGELKSKIPKKLIEQIIEEVDEQLTMTKVLDETRRPNVLEVFEQSSPTEPIPIPNARPLSGEYSAMSSPRSPFPDGHDYVGDSFNFSSSEEDVSVFDQLKLKRDQERLLRIKENLTKYMNKHHKKDDQDDQDTFINKHLQE